MQTVLKYLRDKRLWVPLAFLIGFELLMQTDLYGRYMLKRDSYAEAVRHTVRTVRASEVDPNVLIIGTSVPYQGILLPQLNQGLEDSGLVFQSIAAQGAMIETQYMLYRETRESMPNLKAVIYMVDTALAWKMLNRMEETNRSMMAQFSRFESVSLLHQLQYDMSFDDYVYFFIRSRTYRKDMRDLFVNIESRYKDLAKKWRRPEGDYPYVNEQQFGMDVFEPTDPHDCVRKTSELLNAPGGDGDAKYRDENDVEVSDSHHTNSVLQTCIVTIWESGANETEGKRQWRDLYFMRLGQFFHELRDEGIQVILIYPPYNVLVGELNDEYRRNIWESEVTNILGAGNYYQIDTRRVLDGPENHGYYYDILHLNARGAEVYTDVLIEELRPLAPSILGREDR